VCKHVTATQQRDADASQSTCQYYLAPSCPMSPVSVDTVWLFVAHIAGAHCCRPGPPVPRLLREGISESQAKQLVDSYVPMVNRALGECMQRVSCSALQLLLLSTCTNVNVLAVACLATTMHLTKSALLLAALLYRVCTGRDAVLAAEVLLCISTLCFHDRIVSSRHKLDPATCNTMRLNLVCRWWWRLL
jgi:hypothetical protein